MEFGIREDHLFFVPYCVDNDRLQAAAKDLVPKKSDIREGFGISHNSGPVILWVGRMIAKKQPLFVLEAFRRVRMTTQCTLLMIGSGPLASQLRKKVAEDRIPDVHFAGFLSQIEIERAYASADIFVLASRSDETWGLVVNEAMNFSLPIIASESVGSARDLIRPGVNGFIVSPERPEQLADSISMLVGSQRLRERYGRASRQIINGWNYDLAVHGLVSAVTQATRSE